MKSLRFKSIAIPTLVLSSLFVFNATTSKAQQADKATTSASPTKDFDSETPQPKKKKSKGTSDKRNPPEGKPLQTPKDPELKNRKEDVD